MRIRDTGLFPAALFFSAVSLSCFASPARTAPGVEAFAGFLIPAAGPLDKGPVTGFGLTWPLAGHTRLGVHFLSAGLNSRGESHGLLPGRLTLTPFLVFLRQEVPLGGRLAVHLTAGGGVVFSGFKEEVITIPEVTISQSLPASVALHLACRVSVSLIGGLGFFVQGGYLFCRTTGRTTIRDMNFGTSIEEFSADLSSLQAVAGLAFHI